jgi:hypothetical protein
VINYDFRVLLDLEDFRRPYRVHHPVTTISLCP